jgi:hypothetical protein
VKPRPQNLCFKSTALGSLSPCYFEGGRSLHDCKSIHFMYLSAVYHGEFALHSLQTQLSWRSPYQWRPSLAWATCMGHEGRAVLPVLLATCYRNVVATAI